MSSGRLAAVQRHLRMSTMTSGKPIAAIAKTNVFTSRLPPDPEYPTPLSSHTAPRKDLGPRQVRSAAFTFVRPETQTAPRLLCTSPRALDDLGIAHDVDNDPEFLAAVSGNKIFWEEDGDKPEGKGVYPWAQCYGGYQFLSWAGQLGDGRAISLFETTNASGERYEVQLKGAGLTPYSRFADGKAVLRSSIREFIISEALHAIGIPSTRALALTLLPASKVQRETEEPGAIVTRFAQSWLRVGTFDLPFKRGDRNTVRKLADYTAEEVFGGWDKLPALVPVEDYGSLTDPGTSVPPDELQGPEGEEQNRYARLYRHICRRTAKTVAYWQAYAFTNGVLNTDNTSIYGLSLDFGPFGFLDDFDFNFTPNHDDHSLIYSYRNQPLVVRWSLTRLGEAFGELIGAGSAVDEELFNTEGVSEERIPGMQHRAEVVIVQVLQEYLKLQQSYFAQIMSQRLGLKTVKDTDQAKLIEPLLQFMNDVGIDYNDFFLHLGDVHIKDLLTPEQRLAFGKRVCHQESIPPDDSLKPLDEWLQVWTARLKEDWYPPGTPLSIAVGEQRMEAQRIYNPRFIPRSWVLSEVIDRVSEDVTTEAAGQGHEDGEGIKFLKQVLTMSLHPFEKDWTEWGISKEESARLCKVPERKCRGEMLSCSS